MQRSEISSKNRQKAGKIFKYRVVDFQHGIDVLVLCDRLEDALKAKEEHENELTESDVFITIYDDALGRYIITRYGK